MIPRPKSRPAEPLVPELRDLIARLQQRDDSAWQTLSSRYAPLIRYWLGQMAVRTQDQGDLLQDVFARVLASIDDVDPASSASGFRQWLHLVTRSVRIDLLRRRNRRIDAVSGEPFLQALALSRPQSSSGPEESSAVGGIERARLERALTILKRQVRPRTFEIFEALVLRGQNVIEVSAQFGTRPETVRMIRVRLLRRLRLIAHEVRVA